MQNKGALKLLAVLFAIACAYQLSFTFVGKSVERKAAEYAAQFAPELQLQKEQAYLDSIKSKTVYNLGVVKFNYREVKEKEINLGLDLRGGMNVMLEISVEDVVRALSNNNQDPMFNQAIVEARKAQQNSGDFISAFASAYDKISGGAPLAYLFNTPELKEQITPQTSNSDVISVLRTESESAIANSFNVLRSRIDRFGVAQPNIQRLENSGRILVELPGVKEPERVRKLLQGTASLEFWSTYNNNEIYPILEQANAELAKAQASENTAEATTEEAAATEGEDLLAQLGDSTVNEAAARAAWEKQFPLFSKLNPSAYNGQIAPGPVVGIAMSYDTAAVNKMLSAPQIKAMLPRDLKLMWGVKGIDEDNTAFQLYAIKANTRDGKAPLDGGVITEALATYSQTGTSAEVDMTMNSEGARTWARLTADNINNCIAIVLDGYVYSAPMVHGEISGGRSQITGDFTIQEATDLANVLKSGKLPAPARIIQDTVVGPSLGAESISKGMMSFVIAFCLVLLYMGLFYSQAGWMANVALLCNVFFLMGVLVSFGAVLTLPGIAGIVLTMGMAVDANVIIYERIKEELRAGKGLSAAVTDGFSNALSAILDGNITTIITGIVLFLFGTGPVQGFATTLIIGIITSLFCSIIITRLLISARVEKGKSLSFSNKWSANFLTNTKVDFINLRKKSYIISGVLIAATLISFAVRGFNYGVDFSGGRAYVVSFDQEVTDDQVREQLSTVFTGDDESFEVKQYGAGNQKRIVTQYLYDDQSDDATAKVNEMLYKALNPLFATELTLDQFNSTQEVEYGVIQSDKVGPSVARDIKVNSIISVLFSLLAIGLYIIIRFKKWQWGMGAVVSLTHNALLVMGLYSICYGLFPFTLEVDQSFIAAILTIIGYSINDTVVIFDRIREYQTLYPKRSLKDNINNAINSTLSRTINTSGTTAVTLLAIIIFGGTVIRGFVVALLWGIIVGTYSSVFVATPVAYEMMKKEDAKKAKEA
ncbi:MAG: protein translocase subunit SecDF [Rikenellaceae bacterium]|nr:protein translocase subunit SecDF [Rikenellaceae bacterium]